MPLLAEVPAVRSTLVTALEAGAVGPVPQVLAVRAQPSSVGLMVPETFWLAGTRTPPHVRPAVRWFPAAPAGP